LIDHCCSYEVGRLRRAITFFKEDFIERGLVMRIQGETWLAFFVANHNKKITRRLSFYLKKLFNIYFNELFSSTNTFDTLPIELSTDDLNLFQSY
jgi:hypothetical protein